MKTLGNVLISLLLCLVLLYISFWSIGTIYISAEFLDGATALFPGSGMLGEFVEQGSFLNTHLGLNPITEVHVKQLNFLHALRNLLFVFGCTALSALMIFIMAIAIPFMIIYGAIVGDWETFGSGFIGIIAIPLFAVVALLGIAIFWFLALFQTSTPAYTLSWLIAGIPIIIAGLSAGASPTIVVLAVYK